MSEVSDAYQGDGRLGELLGAAGVPETAAEVRELLAGIAAAPRPIDDDEWLRLIAPAPAGVLRGQLVALYELLASADDGIEEQDASPARLADLRDELKRRGLGGFIVPLADE
ncbi:MAG: aminopeptidase P family protein, partial [Rhodospirillaceae bacterium]|nr:aminopeptidase P family protein [Rhodospirillaceae bacterium]